MSNYTIHTGFWFDHSHSLLLGATVTLPIQWGNRLVSALTVAVTISGSCFWIIAAFVLHQAIVKKSTADILGLQHQVILRNLGSPLGSLWELTKSWLAWRKRTFPRRILRRSLVLMIPTSLIWLSFIIASIFVSEVASKSYTEIQVLLEPNQCGYVDYHFIDIPDFLTGYGDKLQLDTLNGRAYATLWYSNSSSALASSSLFPQTRLPYSTKVNTSCPVNPDYCFPEPSTGFTMETPLLDSHTMFGINAPPENRVQYQKNVTCAVVAGEVAQEQDFNNTLARYFFGPIGDFNWTYQYDEALATSEVDYMLDTVYSNAGQAVPLWEPIPDFNRTDADVSMFFLSQNGVYYEQPVLDPFFLANGSVWVEKVGWNYSQSNAFVDIMLCTDQYRICNPPSGNCTSPGGILQLTDAINNIGLNVHQLASAQRLVNASVSSDTHSSVFGFGDGALLASNVVTSNLSPGLPPNQWQLEAARWFDTSLAKLQSQLVGFASNTPSLYSGGYYIQTAETIPDTPPGIRAAFVSQCKNQRIQSSREVQSFSVLGIGIVVSSTLLLIVLALSLEGCVAVARRESTSDRQAAREADDKLHLLRMVLEGYGAGEEWYNGIMNVPVTDLGLEFVRPILGDNGLAVCDPIVFAGYKNVHSNVE
jgi:hypothetical protein